MDDLTSEQQRLLDDYARKLAERDCSNVYVRVGRLMTSVYASLQKERENPASV